MATFIGDYTCKVDVKGRIILPMAFKKQMPADAQDHFVVRKDIYENCLVLFALEDWNKQLAKIRKKLNPYNREQNMFLRKDGRIEIWAADIYDTISMPAEDFENQTEKYLGGSNNETEA